MKILVIGDTHKIIDKAYETCLLEKDCDLIIHCGDYYADALELAKQLDRAIIAVNGNCDGVKIPDSKIQTIATPYGKIMVSHGHRQHVKQGLDELVDLAIERNCVAVCYGHTHTPSIEESRGIYLINPGSITRPRDGESGSYAIIQCDKNGLKAQIKKLGSSSKSDGKSKPAKEGKLRALLNYSDRF
ncbi:MAG: metallophosphoesterase [Clostridia bacterium]|nr:metallophosphoesterase [Clostridia bacterium]